MHPDTIAALNAAIAAEIAADPASIGYAGRTAAEIADLMNAPVPAASSYRDVSISDVEGYLRARLLVVGLTDWHATAQPSMARSAAGELLSIIASPRLQMFSTGTASGRANILGLFQTLVDAGAGGITQQHHTELAAMTEAPAGPPLPARWLTVIDGISGVSGQPGPPNTATADLIAGAGYGNG